MSIPVEQLLKKYENLGELVERVNSRPYKQPIAIVEYNPIWPKRFEEARERIQTALGSAALAIQHAGSTSVPGLPAKDVIDIDLTVKDVTDESSYLEALNRAGFLLLHREPQWHNHRFLCENWPGAFAVNLHVFGPLCPEVERHRIFRDWLRKTPADRALYAQAKREAAVSTTAAGENVQAYNDRKTSALLEILNRAFQDLGYM